MSFGEVDVSGWEHILDLPGQWNPDDQDSRYTSGQEAPIKVLLGPPPASRIAFMATALGDHFLATMSPAILHNRPQKLGPTLMHDGMDGRLIIRPSARTSSAYHRGDYQRLRLVGTDSAYVGLSPVGWRIPKDSPQRILDAIDAARARKSPNVPRELRFPVQVEMRVWDGVEASGGGQPFEVTFERFDRANEDVVLRFKALDAYDYVLEGYLSTFGKNPHTLYVPGGRFKGYAEKWYLSPADAQRILVAWDVLVGGG